MFPASKVHLVQRLAREGCLCGTTVSCSLQSLVLVREVIHGTPSRFEDPARFSMAHGEKDCHPFPVPLKVFDRSIGVLKEAVRKAKLGQGDKLTGCESGSKSLSGNMEPAAGRPRRCYGALCAMT